MSLATMISWLLLLAQIVSLGLAMPAFINSRVRYDRRYLRGRLISKHVVRRIGLLNADKLWLALLGCCIALFVGWAIGSLDPLLMRPFYIAWYAWVADDYWTGDDDRWKKWWEGAKAKLRKAKPVMRRLAERWKPVPAPMPRPA